MYGIQREVRQQHRLLRDSKAKTEDLKVGLLPTVLPPSQVIGSPNGQSWTHPSMTLSVRDLLSDNLDKGEELHMTLPTSKRRCSDRRKMLLRMPFASTLPPGQEVSLRRVRPGIHTPCHGDNPAVLPLRRAGSGSIEENEGKDKSALRLGGEMYPRFRLDTIVGKDELASALCSFRETLELDSAEFGGCYSDDGEECTMDFVKSQEELWQQIKQERQRERTSDQERPSMEPCPHSCTRSADVAGTKIKILEQERVYAALSDGSAMMLKCIGCGKHMLATSDIMYVFCPNCSTLSPVDLAYASSGKVKM